MKLNTLRPGQNGRHFADDIFKCILLNENVWTSIQISLKFVPKGPINNIPALVQIMAWRRPGHKPLSEPMMVRLPTPICVTRPQWVKGTRSSNESQWRGHRLPPGSLRVLGTSHPCHISRSLEIDIKFIWKKNILIHFFKEIIYLKK